MKARNIAEIPLRPALRLWEYAHCYRVSEKTLARWRDAGFDLNRPAEIYASVKKQRTRPRGMRGKYWATLVALRVLEKRAEGGTDSGD